MFTYSSYLLHCHFVSNYASSLSNTCLFPFFFRLHEKHYNTSKKKKHKSKKRRDKNNRKEKPKKDPMEITQSWEYYILIK